MPELSIANIEIIESEVARAGITFSHLREELVDHICCEARKNHNGQSSQTHQCHHNDLFHYLFPPSGKRNTLGRNPTVDDHLGLNIRPPRRYKSHRRPP